MFGLFKKKQKLDSPPLYFKDGDTAFGFACTLSKPDVEPGDVVPAIVVSLSQATEKGQNAQITFASPEGGRPALCPVADSVGALKPGDLVAFRIFEVNPNLNSMVGVHGAIVGRLAPEFSPGNGWRVDHGRPV